MDCETRNSANVNEACNPFLKPTSTGYL